MLHTVNKSPFQANALLSCLRVVKKGSAILLIEDGVYGALVGTKATPTIQEAMKNSKVYALAPDLEARGIQDNVLKGVKTIDYGGFVDLVAEYDTVQAWL
ncbi:MAG TPA: sulfurtransferase complex subunit TusB [Acidiferrobacteraceae bacterium]|nr:sulfurtransferase complex subunit TusB [Acidiferrobacteraceae bacterium]